MNDTPSTPVADDPSGFRSGFIAIVGRPNVGKSTLLNRLVGQKISIVSRKAQTTRHRVNGIRSDDDAQYVFVDTPGFQTRYRSALNSTMNRNVTQALADVDVVFLVVEAGRFDEEDRQVLEMIPSDTKAVLVINKIDRLADKTRLLPYIDSVRTEREFDAVVPLSAERDRNVDTVLEVARSLLPEGPQLFSEDEITDRSERFLAAEFLREKLFRLLGDELPYGVAVEIEKFETEGRLRRIFAAVIVDRPSHKGMVVGRKGERMKRIASEARVELEKLFDARVHLEVWVKVRSGWADDERALKSLGYD